MASVLKNTWGSIGDYVSKKRNSIMSPTNSSAGSAPPGAGAPSVGETGKRRDGGPLRFCGSGAGSTMGTMSMCGSVEFEDEAALSGSAEQRSMLEQYLAGQDIQKGEDNDSGLRKLCWKGIPAKHRAECWKLLTGYLPTSKERRAQDLQRKRQEYHDNVAQRLACEGGSPTASNTSAEFEAHLKVIRKDVPRTAPSLPFFQHPLIQGCYERVLSVWALRHPTPGYVQGMNDLVTPFLFVFLSNTIDRGHMVSTVEEIAEEGIAILQKCPEALENTEADVYWCLNRMLDSIQDNYTDHQPGIQTKMLKLERLLTQVVPDLAAHFQEQEVSALQYAFRYINCLFVREFPLPMLVRLWDTFLSEGDDFPDLQVYMCLALLESWSPTLVRLEFTELIGFLQSPPTGCMTATDVDMLISRAFQLQLRWNNAHQTQAHG
eukprot:TRINITY_DN38176_c0_g1_i1.p2 TRINITY_DN38176_c0_g1~~TRINITY_DN38176_c0_g1_i1.p2  ORF type:complete len:433 (+),score=117.20 TRINITY_DN38176_c0_g1_i1:26-1324(+)